MRQHDAPLAAAGRPAMDETSTRAIVNEERVVEIRGITPDCAQSNTARPAAGFREMQHAPALTGQGENIVGSRPAPRTELVLVLPRLDVPWCQSPLQTDGLASGDACQGAGPERIVQSDAVDHCFCSNSPCREAASILTDFLSRFRRTARSAGRSVMESRRPST